MNAPILIPENEWNDLKQQVTRIGNALESFNQNNQQYLTPKEVCKMLNIGRATYERFKNDSKIKTYRIEGTKRMYCKKIEIEELMNKKNE